MSLDWSKLDVLSLEDLLRCLLLVVDTVLKCNTRKDGRYKWANMYEQSVYYSILVALYKLWHYL